ncbi:MAG: hypothetical protein EAZ42_09645 [Verrucomicrobia bacterium]|nr:MAG: hypothetical protein EAZ42_09645 [Verrucomicrobiota bacterium]
MLSKRLIHRGSPRFYRIGLRCAHDLVPIQKNHSMKFTPLFLLASTPLLLAGTPDSVISEPAASGDWIKPLIDLRARYEFADIDPAGPASLDESSAFSIRGRLGFETTDWNGFSALLEGEFSQALVDDYHGGALGADPFNPTQSVIADPETYELNQGYIQYSGHDTVVKLGRQRIVYDKAAFVGNVIWRQNEQTYDAISVTGKWVDDLTVNYAYLAQVNRIFGSEAIAPNVGYVDSNSHLFNFSYTGFSDVKLGGYAYLMKFDDKPNWDNNTFGISASKSIADIEFYGELAWQDNAGFAANSDAFYIHATATKEFGKQSITAGIESLDAGFKTPLATLHAFNGFADVFVAGRGEGSHNGLLDAYVSHSMPLFWGMKWTNTIHAYGDNELSAGYGWELDSVLVKKFDEHFTAIAKGAYFVSEGDNFVGLAALPDATRFSIELNYKF